MLHEALRVLFGVADAVFVLVVIAIVGIKHTKKMDNEPKRKQTYRDDPGGDDFLP